MVSTVGVDGLTIAYRRAGHGETLVLLHGYVGDSRTWTYQIDDLCEEFAVVAWDAPGFGESSAAPDSFTLADYADCLAKFIAALDIRRPTVCGLSFGGGLALELYRRHRGVPAALVLVSAYAGWAGSLPPEVVEQRLAQALKLAALGPDRLVAELMPTMFTDATRPEVADHFADAMRGTHPSGLRATARAFAEADVRDVLARIDVPTLLVYGDRDVRAPLDIAEALHGAIRGSKLVVLADAGHILNVEAADRFNAEVRAFLRSTLEEQGE